MEDYRIKQQQQQQHAMAPPAVMPRVPPPIPVAAPPAMGQPTFPLVAQPLQHSAVIPGHTSPARMPSLPGWQPPSAPAHLPLNPPRVQPPVAQLPMKTCTSAPGTVPNANPQSGPPPRVEFDDNNPFSESFQERERKERLREQQERQRIQLMQEVDRQRALQQRMELEQHGLIGPELSSRTAVPQAPFYGPDLPCDFLQPPRPLQQSPQQQQQVGQVLQQQSMPQGSVNPSPTPTFMQTNERRQIGPPSLVPDSSVPGGSPTFHPGKQAHSSLPGAGFQQSPVRAPFTPALPTASPGANSSLPCGQDPALTHGQGYPGSAQSLIQLYSDIIPEEKGKKKRTRKKKKDDDVESTKAPSTPHSDITAPPTPSVSETTSTPTVHTPSELPLQGEPEPGEAVGSSVASAAAGQRCTDLENSLPHEEFSQGTPHQQTSATAGADTRPASTPATVEEVKPEMAEPQQYPGPEGPPSEGQAGSQAADAAVVCPISSGQSPPPAAKGDLGNELLKHLLKNKKAAALVTQKPEGTCCPQDDSTKDSKPAERQTPAKGPVSEPRPCSCLLSPWRVAAQGPCVHASSCSLRLGRTALFS